MGEQTSEKKWGSQRKPCHKAVLHIPLQAFQDGTLADIDISKEIDDLIARLESIGITGLYEIQDTGHYKGRAYPETLLTAYGNDNLLQVPDIFKRWASENKAKLAQEEYAYELDGELFLFTC